MKNILSLQQCPHFGILVAIFFILRSSWAQANPSSMVNCGEPSTITDKTPTDTCCTQANGIVVRDNTGQIRGCVIADYAQPAVSSAFQTCCSREMVLYDAVGEQAADDSNRH